MLVSIEEIQLSTGEVLRLEDLVEGASGALELPKQQEPAPMVDPQEETSLGDGPVDSELTRIEIVDPSNGGMVIQTVNNSSPLAKELGLTIDAAVYVATEKAAQAEINGQLVKVNYWSVNANKMSKDGPLISSSALETVEALGDIYMQADVLVLGEGSDRFMGRREDNVVFGGAGRDALDGRSGNDTLDGGDDNDWINGGKGDDIVTGGAGEDRFYFQMGYGDDRITDFEQEDTLLLGNFFQGEVDVQTAVTAQSDGVLISNGTDSILLEGLTEADMNWVIQDNIA